MNYSELLTAVQDYTENTFSSDVFARMTRLAEQKIYNATQLPTLRKNVTGTLTPSSQYLNAPVDFLSAFSLAVVDGTGKYTYLLNKDVNFIRESYPAPTTTGLPRYYALFGPNGTTTVNITLILGPTPDAAYSTELHYFAYPESIVTANTTWLGDNFDSVLFNGVMVEAAREMKAEADIVALYDKEFMQSLELLKNLGDGKDRRDAYRSGQLRVPVK